ncbi:hypothetical protein EC968_004875 [Mortierella alpina]|nr:hypothetical protein EC968_004875 [Mortierella alpina]
MTHTPTPPASNSGIIPSYATADSAGPVSLHLPDNSGEMHMHPTHARPGDQPDWTDNDTSFESAQDSSSGLGQYTAMAIAQLTQAGQHGQHEQQGPPVQPVQPMQQPWQAQHEQLPWQRLQHLQQTQVQPEHDHRKDHVSAHSGVGEGAPSSSSSSSLSSLSSLSSSSFVPALARAQSNLAQSAQSLKQQLSILHPALSATSSSNAPAIYALTSSVPYPTINQLSMSLPHDPVVSNTLPMPFETAMGPPATLAGAMAHSGSLTDSISASGPSFSSPTSLTLPPLSSPTGSQSHTLHHYPTSTAAATAAATATATATAAATVTATAPGPVSAPAHISASAFTSYAPQAPHAISTAPFAPADGRGALEGSNMSMSGRTQDDIHPYFAGTNFSTVPNSPQDRRVGPSSPTRTRPHHANGSKSSHPSSGLTSPTAYFTPTSTATSVSSPHSATPAVPGVADNRETVGSRSSMFEFAPAYNQGDHHQPNVHMNKERVRPASTGADSRQNYSNQVHPEDQQQQQQQQRQSSSSSSSSSTAARIRTTTAGDAQNSTAIPNARAGICQNLTLGPLSTLETRDEPKLPTTEMLAATKDWSTTGLGPRSSWPMELTVFVQMMMRSESPLAIYWGEECYLIYNEAWRPILKQKHPLAMGAPGSTVWAEIWDVIGAQMAQVRRDGRGYGNKGLRLDLHREGYEEECYFDFTFSPIFMRDGTVGGIFADVIEVTKSILNQRRLSILNEFSKKAAMIQSVSGAYSMITSILHESNILDVTFSLVYKTVETAKDEHRQFPFGPYSPLPSKPSLSASHSSSSTNSVAATAVAATTASNASNQTLCTPAQDEFLAAGSPAGIDLDREGDSSAMSQIRLIRSHFCSGLRSDKKDVRRAPQSAILCSTSFDRNLEVVNYGGANEKIFSKATSIRHIPDSLLITPEEYEPLDPAAPVYDDPWAWPVRSVLADGIPRLVTLPKSEHKLARALLLPVLENPSVLESRITTVLIVGINPYQMLDNQYLDFLALLVANIASLLHFGQSREEERKSNEALFELNKAKISFFQNISHELRTPLTLMMAPLDDVLNQTPENAVTRPSLEMVRRNTRRLLKLVNTLLQFSRIEAGKGHAIFEETDLTKATREISANFESVARGFNLEYSVICEDLDNIPGGFWVDRAMWSGIILNLIGNALKHTWEGSVSVHQYPCKGKNGRDGVALEVRDTGVGIAAEHLPTLFERFNRIENKQSRSHEGTGIGLSLVKELTEVHGGTVSVTSVVDKGSCFQLWIPAGRNHHSSAQVKMGDTQDRTSQLKSCKSEIMNNKTDASMFVEEASQWIAHKAFPGSTLITSGTDSTEEEQPEVNDDSIHVMQDHHHSMEINTDFEVSTLDLEEEELSRILLDSPESGSAIVPGNALAQKKPESAASRRMSSASNGKRLTSSELMGLAFSEEPVPAMETRDTMYECSVNDDGGYGGQVQTKELADEPDADKTMLQRARSRRGYIIVVDDNNDMRAYLREILGKDFRVRCAVDGLDAMRIISQRVKQEKRIDLVLSDVAMPNMNGYELLKRIRSDSKTMLTPLILLSARAGEEANVEGLDLGADDCLVKPFSARELLARVRSTIRLSDLRHELLQEQKHALEMKQLIFSISVKIRSGLSLSGVLQTASSELFKVIRCNAIRICRFRRADPETGQHWVRFISEIVRVGRPKVLSPQDRLLPKGLEVSEDYVSNGGEDDSAGDVRQVNNYHHPIFGAKSFLSVALLYNRKIWGYLLASRDSDMVDWSNSEKLLFEQTGYQISLAIAHASLWELKKSQQVEMEAAHAANEAKSQILANTSHELRTPIGAIVGALSALEDTAFNLTGEQKDMVKIMQITSDVALSVINDLLDTAKLEAGAMSLSIKECPGLVETLEQSVRIFADKAGRKEVDLIMEPSEDLEGLETMLRRGYVIWTDGDRLQQVIMNLIGNAVKFTAHGKVVTSCSFVTAGSPSLPGEAGSEEQQQQQLQYPQQPSHPRVHQPVQIPADAQVTHVTFRFEVSDTGIGIDPDFLKNHIFKSFAQYDQSMTRRFGGTGLGLAISKHLVMMNGGILGVTSNVGQGSTFYFTWPVMLVLPNPASSSTHPAPWVMAPKPVLSPEVAFETRAVVVEPVTESRHLLGWILNQQNVQVTLYENYENVVQDEQQRSPHLTGPDGSILTPNYRPNAHFFFCVRDATEEITIETARALGEIFKQRNAKAKASGNTDTKDVILSIVLVVFSAPRGRSMAKDIKKKILSHGLEDTVQCEYIVKPVKLERIVERLQTLGPHAPITRGMTGHSPEIIQAGTLQSGNTSRHRSSRSHRHHHQQQQQQQQQQQPQQQQQQQSSHASAVPRAQSLPLNASNVNSSPPSSSGSQVIPADGNVSLVSSDYERGNDYNKNTPESAPLGPDGVTDGMNSEISPVLEASRSISPSTSNGARDQQQTPAKRSPSASRNSATMPTRRLRQKTPAGDARPIPAAKSAPGIASTDESLRSSSENPAFSNRAARAAAGKRERRGKCVLCVEDNIINLRVVQYQLQKLGYDTQSASDGQVAVDIIRAQIEQLEEGVASMSTDEKSATEDTAAGGADSDVVMGSADETEDKQPPQQCDRALLRRPLSIVDGLIADPANNINKSHTFDQSDAGALTSMIQSTTPLTSPSLSFTNRMSAEMRQPLRPSSETSSLNVNGTSPSSVSSASLGSSLTASRSPSLGGKASPDLSALAPIIASRMSPTNNPSRKRMSSALASSSSSYDNHPKIDLILMDCAMPIKSGFDAAAEIRQMGVQTPIIALTASAVPSTKEKCIASGMNGYLSKPTKLSDLEAMLDQWID